MPQIPSIDLHPEKVPGDGPEAALRACRQFLDQCLRAGHRQARIITGVGLRGDGTARLRTRVEQEVLGAYFSQIEQQAYEQGGAVIKLWLRSQQQKPAASWHRQQRQRQERSQVAGREERLLVAGDRLDAAWDALDEGDLRRCRLKLNQVAREFGWDLLPPGIADGDAERALKDLGERLKRLDA